MNTRRSFMKTVLGCVGGLLGINVIKAETIPSEKTKDSGKVEIEYLSFLGGNITPFMIQHQATTQALTLILEAPFIIYWDGWKGHRKGCPMGNIEIDLREVKNKTLIRNIDPDKLTNWIISHLAVLPKSTRVQKYVVGEMAWVARISLDTVKTLQKNG